MTSRPWLSSFVSIIVASLGCNQSVIEAPGDEVAEDSSTGGDGDSSSSSDNESSSTSTGDTGDTTETGSDSSSSETSSCMPGMLDCPCDAGSCEAGLICVDDTCVDDAGTDTTDSTDSTDTGEPLHNCGWISRKNYYFCGGDLSEDPSMLHARDCSEFVFPMVEGAACGPELDYVGCCDANGDAWYCLEDFIEYEVCGAL
ncbi:hypothetical protein ACNOYE_19015 [Nannocystaceae bacterium ST9]